MNASIYRSVVYLARVGAAAWGLVILLWVLTVFWVYSGVGRDQVFADYLEAMPQQIREAVGISGPEEMQLVFDDGAFTFVGYLNTEFLTWLPVLLGVYAVVYCGGLVSREVERGTLDTLLSQPVARTTFLLSKVAGFATLVFAVTTLSLLAVLVGAPLIGSEVSVPRMIAVHAVALLLILAIAGYSTLASCLLLDPGRSLALAGVVTALTYFANIVGVGVAGLGWLRYLSLFYYYDSLQVAAAGAVHWAGVAVYAAVFAVAIAASAAVFRRRDLVL